MLLDFSRVMLAKDQSASSLKCSAWAWSRKQLSRILAGLALGAALDALAVEPSSGPYEVIVQRNVFGLKPARPPQFDPPPNTGPPAKITLTGITTILGDKRALMKTAARPGTPIEPAKPEQFYILAEGQRDGDLEVLQIDETAGTVKLKNGGGVATVSFDENGVQPLTASAPPPPGPVGAVPILPPPPAPKPGRLIFVKPSASIAPALAPPQPDGPK